MAKIALRARVGGLLLVRDEGWGVNGDKLARGIERARRRGQSKGAERKRSAALPAVMVLYGLGELCARCSAPPEPSALKLAKLSHPSAISLLKQAAQLAQLHIPATPVVEISARDALAETALLPHHIWFARNALMRPRLSRYGVWGLRFVMDICLHYRPRSFGHWAQARQYPVFGDVALSLVAQRLTFATAGGDMRAQVLQTGVPVLQAMVAASLVNDHPWSPPACLFEDACCLLERAGVPESRAFVLALASAKTTVQARAYARDREMQAEHAVRLAQASKAENSHLPALGTAEDARAEMAASILELRSARSQRDKAVRQVDALMREMALRWPYQANGPGFSNPPIGRSIADGAASKDSAGEDSPSREESNESLVEQDLLHFLRAAFPFNFAEVATSIASHLLPSRAGQWLLEEVMEQLSQLLALRHPQDAFEAHFAPNLQDFATLCEWASRAYWTYYKQDAKGPGYRTSLALAALIKASDAALDAPHAAYRWMQRYQTALRRRLCAVCFALVVAQGHSEAQAGDGALLMKIALKQAQNALRFDRDDVDAGGWTWRLAMLSAKLMAYGKAPDLRREWCRDAAIPMFVKCICIWSDPQSVEMDTAHAEQIFLTSTRQSGRTFDPQQFIQRAVAMLDHAVAFCAATEGGLGAHQGHDLGQHTGQSAVQSIRSVWPRVLVTWAGAVDERFASLPDELLEAVQRPGRARRKLLADKGWAESACVFAIRGAMDGAYGGSN